MFYTQNVLLAKYLRHENSYSSLQLGAKTKKKVNITKIQVNHLYASTVP